MDYHLLGRSSTVLAQITASAIKPGKCYLKLKLKQHQHQHDNHPRPTGSPYLFTAMAMTEVLPKTP